MSTARSPLQLGRHVPVPHSPAEAKLERVPNPHPGTKYLARFTCPEFTSLCPVTGQPDFGILVIDYLPGKWLLEFEIAEALPRELPQPRRLSRGLHDRGRQEDRRARRAALSSHRRLLVPPRRHSDRRVLADREAPSGPVAPRSRHPALSCSRVVRRRARRSLPPPHDPFPRPLTPKGPAANIPSRRVRCASGSWRPSSPRRRR